MSYDDWKLATPWDSEIAITVSFDCHKCEGYNEGVEAITSRGDEEVFVECGYCEVENTIYRGGN
jgi:hypothetical protein